MLLKTRKMPFSALKLPALLILLVLLSLSAHGCLWLALPSLAYEGYKYSHPSTTSQRHNVEKPSSGSQQPSTRGAVPDTSIE